MTCDPAISFVFACLYAVLSHKTTTTDGGDVDYDEHDDDRPKGIGGPPERLAVTAHRFSSTTHPRLCPLALPTRLDGTTAATASAASDLTHD